MAFGRRKSLYNPSGVRVFERENRGRPTKTTGRTGWKTLTLNLDAELYERLEKEAIAQRTTKADIVRKALREYLTGG